MSYIMAVVGGDMRHRQLASSLAAMGHTVKAYALGGPVAEPVFNAATLAEAVSEADCVILPIPAQGAQGALNTCLHDNVIEPIDVFAGMKPGAIAAAGKVSDSLRALAFENGVRLYDYLEREEFAVFNAIPTAEGAIQTAMEELPATIHGSRFLVIGYGRIGKVLAKSLKALGGIVDVAARKCSDLAWIRASDYTSVDMRAIKTALPRCDIVFNTAPAMVLDRERLKLLKKDALVIDLASKPGGVDFAAAKALGVRVIWALSLPGKVAPVTAGEIIGRTALNILDEVRGEVNHHA